MAGVQIPRKVARLPLPNDSNEADSYFFPEPRRGPGLIVLFTILVAASAALLLSPCFLLSPAQIIALEFPTYERFCSSVVQSYTGNSQHTTDSFGDAEMRDTAWDVMSQAPMAAWTAVIPLWAKAKGHATRVWERMQPPAWESGYPGMVSHAAALVDSVSARWRSPYTPPLVESGPINSITVSDFWSLLDQRSVRREHLQTLWDSAATDAPTMQKATVWMLTCSVEDECSAAASVLKATATSHFLVEGPRFSHPSDAGLLQHELLTYLWSQSDGLVLVSQAASLHPNALRVLANELSESGQLQAGGRSAPSKRPVFMFLVQSGPAGAIVSARNKDAAAAKWFASSSAATAPDAVYAPAVVWGFRRHVDAVLPLRKLPGVLSDGSDPPGASTDLWPAVTVRRFMQGYQAIGVWLRDLLRKGEPNI